MKRFMILMVTLSLIIFTAVLQAQCVIQLTDNDFDDLYPDIHNGQVVWEGGDGNDSEIFFWDGELVIQITDNEITDYFPQLHNGQITWEGRDGEDSEIFLFDGETVNQLTDNDYDDEHPQIHDGQVVWVGWVWSVTGSHEDIFYWDGVTTTNLSNSYEIDSNPKIHNGGVVWMSSVVNYWDGNSITQLDDYQKVVRPPDIHNGLITWVSQNLETIYYEHSIFLSDGNSVTKIAYFPQEEVNNIRIDDGLVVWDQCYLDVHNYNCYISLWENSSVTLTESGCCPDIHNGQVVWNGTTIDNPWSNSYNDLCFWNGESTVRFSKDNGYPKEYPKIHNGQIVWQGWDGNDWEIFVTCPRSHDRPVDRPGSDSDRDEPEELRFISIGQEVSK